MSKVKVVLNSAGVRNLLHSEGIKSDLVRQASAAQSRAGEHYGYFPFEMETRSVVRLSPIDKEGAIDNSENNTLLKAVFGG